MTWDHVQALVLRPPPAARAVLHLLLRVAQDKGGAARRALGDMLQEWPLSVGEETAPGGVHCTLGFTYRGLEALGMPPGYLRVFARLAPAFTQGAPLRAAQLGDSGASAPRHWDDAFRLDHAHVLATFHGGSAEIDRLQRDWQVRTAGMKDALQVVARLRGDRLGAPPAETGEWVHFGLRDGLVDHRIAGTKRGAKDPAIEIIDHAAGEFLLGRPNDNGYNPFGLAQAPAEVRCFFRDSSFGVLRPMAQDVHQFERKLLEWRDEAWAHLGTKVGTDWVKAKLCGRWPSGEPMRPGENQPARGSMKVDFTQDAKGQGCPWSSHIRRMDPRGHPDAAPRHRIVLRRAMPYGPANWEGTQDQVERGLLGFFFCASLEDQFEPLLGQWASGAPPGCRTGELAGDPLAGQHGDRQAAVLLPLKDQAPLRLTGLQAWTRTRGTAYTWHPHAEALQRLLGEHYLAADAGGPWL